MGNVTIFHYHYTGDLQRNRPNSIIESLNNVFFFGNIER